MFNVHAHIFTVKDVPVNFLQETSIPQWATKKIVRMLQGPAWQQKLAMGLIGKTEEGKKYKAFVNIGIHKSMDEVFELLWDNNGYPEGTKFVALPMQFEYMGAGDCESHSYDDQITELIRTKKMYPDTLYPFYAIDPRMGATSAEVLSHVEKHMLMAIPVGKDANGTDIYSRVFSGIKMYPSLGFFPYDPLLLDTYRYAETNDLPIMTHASRGGVFYSGKRGDIDGIYGPRTMNRRDPFLLEYTSTNPDVPAYKEPKYTYPDIDNEKVLNSAFCDYFLDPENYTDALGLFPKLKICFAHFGSDSEISTKLNIKLEGTDPANGSPRNDTWYDKILMLLKMKEYPNLYTDISYTLHIPEFRELVKKEVEDDLKNNGSANLSERLISKILFGTDFFMTYREKDMDEKTLVADARKDFLNITQASHPNLYALGPNTLWDYMTEHNPKRYLSSKFITF